MIGAVNVGPEDHTILADLADMLQAEDLKPAAVGEDAAAPVDELVQPAGALDKLVAGPEVEVVGVAEYDPISHIAQFFLAHGLDRALGAHGHEDGGLDGTVTQVQTASPGVGLGISG